MDDSNNRYAFVGHLVRSKAGRDKGCEYLVLDLADDGKSLYVVDGRKRGVGCPKRKNIIHLQMTNKISQEFRRKVTAKEPLRNEEIRSYLTELGIEQ